MSPGKRRSLVTLVCAVLGLEAWALGTSACGARTELPVWGVVGEGGAGQGGGPSSTTTGGGGSGGELPDAPPDVPDAPVECADPSTTFIYLVTSEQELFSYNPASGAVAGIGFISCPSAPGATPFSMGVDRAGTAYVVYNDGNLYRVSTKDASCEETDFVPGQNGFDVFGMGFALDAVNGQTDQLYVAEISFDQPSLGLGTIDTESLDLDFIGGFSDPPGNVLELTSSSDGNLYGYFLGQNGGGTIVELDKITGDILAETPLQVGDGSSALAFAWWGGDFFIFTSPGGTTTITRYTPGGTPTFAGTIGQTVVGAGVSTCAPQ